MRRSTTAQARTTGDAAAKPARPGPPAPAEGPLPFERRGSGRTRVRGEGVATFIDPDGRLWLSRVHLVDRSGSGLGVRAPVRATAGASFSMVIDGATVHGIVAHSCGRGGAYRLGLRCAVRAAA